MMRTPPTWRALLCLGCILTALACEHTTEPIRRVDPAEPWALKEPHAGYIPDPDALHFPTTDAPKCGQNVRVCSDRAGRVNIFTLVVDLTRYNEYLRPATKENHVAGEFRRLFKDPAGQGFVRVELISSMDTKPRIFYRDPHEYLDVVYSSSLIWRDPWGEDTLFSMTGVSSFAIVLGECGKTYDWMDGDLEAVFSDIRISWHHTVHGELLSKRFRVELPYGKRDAICAPFECQVKHTNQPYDVTCYARNNRWLVQP